MGGWSRGIGVVSLIEIGGYNLCTETRYFN